ncbi:MAG: MarR family transcriptional regulator [Kofleriaceae bacterium]
MSRTNASPEIIDQLFQVSFALHAILGTIAAAHELSLIQVRMFGILRDRQPLMQELAAFLGLEKSSLSGLVDRAEARGLVERVPHDQDARAMTIRMTAAGKKLSRVVEQEVYAKADALLAHVTKPDQHRLGEILALVLR